MQMDVITKIAALAPASLWSSHALAQSDHLHTPAAPEKLTAAQQIKEQTRRTGTSNATPPLTRTD